MNSAPSKALVGVSTAVMSKSSQIEDLLWYEPDLIEIYNFSSGQVAELCKMTSRHDIFVALHTPTPFDDPNPLRRYCPTGPNSEEAVVARRLVTQTVAHAEAIGALHVVVHYPSPYPPFVQGALDYFGPPFLEHLENLVARHGVPILIENLSAHPWLRRPEHYAAVMERHPELGFCLDLGHAHLMPPPTGPESYAEALGRRVRSMHVYNTTPDRYPRYGHEMAGDHQLSADGYMDLGTVLHQLLRACSPRTLVLEHGGPVTPYAAKVCGEWMRRIIESGGGKQNGG